jgi:hypothetical protein
MCTFGMNNVTKVAGMWAVHDNLEEKAVSKLGVFNTLCNIYEHNYEEEKAQTKRNRSN